MKININTILAGSRRNSAFGAPMGDWGYIDDDQPLSGLLCQRVRLVDGGYGPDGTYWGFSPRAGHIYAVFNGPNAEFKPACGLLKYYRAHTRADAISQFSEDYEGYKFSRGAK